MAQLHVRSGTPGLLTDLGESFLKDVYYRGLLESSLGHGLGIDVGEELAGFVTYSEHSEQLFDEIARRRPVHLVLAVLRAALRRPRLVQDVVESRRIVGAPGLGREVTGEVVSLEVAARYQGLGLGFFLLEAAVLAINGPVKARILHGHTEVGRLYERLGFQERASFRMHRRDWVLLAREHVA